jgi:CRISPR-associated protein Csx10
MSKHWPLPESFRVRLTMESDWHVGSGMGRPGNIDRLIVRDADGLPFVPAKTLRGIWRDACERLCRGLDDGQLGGWSRWVDSLLGSQPALGQKDPTGRHGDPSQPPLESAVQVRSARIPSSLREQLIRADRRLREAMTFVKPRVKIDRRSGSTHTDHLRFEEMARRGTILEAECRLTVPQEMGEAASALLIASAKLVERLGGKRRRGPGRCRLEIIDANVDVAIEWLERNASVPAWSPANGNRESSGDHQAAARDDPWISVLFLLKLQGPLAISYRTIGNVVETLDFMPGSYLLPHVSRRLDGLGGLDVRSALQAGDVCVLPATPEVDGERGLPVPLALFAPKGGKGLEERDKVVNRLLCPEPTDGTQLKQLREGYLSARPSKAYKTPITVHTHNTVEDQPQRPTSDVGGVYTYEAIAAVDEGQPVRLRGELRLRKSLASKLASAQPDWWMKLDGVVSLGRSRKDDYGSVLLETRPAADWSSTANADATELCVWLVSDTLIRNDQLRPEATAKALGEELGRRLGVKLTIRESGNSGLLDELVRIRRLDTWHVGWGLPRPSLVALQAGSCAVFGVQSTIDPVKLRQLEAGGIGERTAEGYGQVRFNHPLLTKMPTQWPASPAAAKSGSSRGTAMAIPSNDLAFAFARLLERECWKQEIRRACLAIAGDTNRRQQLLRWIPRGEQGQPPMSQLGGLRGQLILLRRMDDRRLMIAWLEHLVDNQRRRETWPNGSIPEIRRVLDQPGRIWEIIDTTNWPTLIQGAATQLQQELWPLAVRTFFDACIRAHKRELEVPSGT